MTTDAEKINETGRCAYAAIVEMVEALHCNYDRIDELLDNQCAEALTEDEAEELRRLRRHAGECKDRDEAEERIQEDALSVEVRSGWTCVRDALEPEEFRILITTGGPAVQIRGELDADLEPRRAWLEVQDWFLPWTQYVPADQNVLLDYARCFYFGG